MTAPGHDWQLVSLDAAAAQPWRNGGGTTRELLVWLRHGSCEKRAMR